MVVTALAVVPSPARISHQVHPGPTCSETFGVKRLGELLEERFGVRHTFVEIPNPI
jgi:hypothetical protein